MIFEEFQNQDTRKKLLTKEVVTKIFDRYFDKREYKSADPVQNKHLKWRMEMLQLVIFSSALRTLS
jgi:hypothetical protein